MSKKSKLKKASLTQKLPSLANHPIHSIPINIMEALGGSSPSQTVSSSPTAQIPPAAMMPYQQLPSAYNNMIPAFHPHPAYFMNPLSYYWPLYSNPGFSNAIPASVDTDALHEAATLIQKTYRGYLVRREFISIDFNPIVKKENPPLYWTEFYLYQVIQDSIIDCLVEIGQTAYYPISRKLEAHNLLYHLTEQMIHEVAFKSLDDAKLKKKGIIITEKWESGEQMFLLDELNHFTKDVILESVKERVDDNMLEMNSDLVLTILHNEIIRDDIFVVLYDVIMDFVYESILGEIIRKQVYSLAPSLCKSANIELIMDRPSKKKSKRIDAQMDEILDVIVMEELALALASPLLDEGELEKEINFAIVQNLLSRI